MGFKDAFNRIRLETELQTQEQLATFLGIKQASVSGAKKRGHFPRGWAEKLAKHYNLRYEWIMEGTEPKQTVSGLDQNEIGIIVDQLRFIFAKASPADRLQIKNLISKVFQKIRELA